VPCKAADKAAARHSLKLSASEAHSIVEGQQGTILSGLVSCSIRLSCQPIVRRSWAIQGFHYTVSAIVTEERLMNALSYAIIRSHDTDVIKEDNQDRGRE
jgi:hypothetical protein